MGQKQHTVHKTMTENEQSIYNDLPFETVLNSYLSCQKAIIDNHNNTVHKLHLANHEITKLESEIRSLKHEIEKLHQLNINLQLRSWNGGLG